MDPLLKLGGPTSLSVLLRLQFSSACDSGGHHTLLAPTTSRILTQCFAPKKPMSRWLLSCLHLVIMPIPLILILLCSEADDLRRDTSSWLSPMLAKDVKMARRLHSAHSHTNPIWGPMSCCFRWQANTFQATEASICQSRLLRVTCPLYFYPGKQV